MSDRDDSNSYPTPPTPAASLTAGTGNVAPEDLVCLQSAFEEWEHERERLLARLRAVEADAHAKLQHAERRLSEALSQLEATKRSAQAVRLRLGAEVQAARTRAREAQEAFAAGQTVAEQLRVANAELSTALDATQWRLGELEAESTAHRETLLHIQQERLAELQRLAELEGALAARDTLAHQLAEEQLQARSARDDASALATRIEGIEAELHAAHEQRQQVEQQLTVTQSERSALEDALQQLRVAHVEELTAWQQAAAQHETELLAARDALGHQLAEERLQARRARDDATALAARIEGIEADLRAAHEQRQQVEQHLAAAQTERRSLEETLEQLRTAHADELDAWQHRVVEHQSDRDALASRVQILEDELRQRGAYIEQLRADVAQLEERQAQALQTAAEATRRREEEWRASERTLREDLDGVRRNLADVDAARMAELENERSAVALRVDELTALTGELERECDRLRRDRGSSEDTRRLKAENVRLEAKIVELDRQRAEAVRRHSAAVAGYMVELTQRSEALYARETELQKLTEEVELLKQSCEDAVGELTGQRRQQEMLEREVAQLRAAPAQSPASTSAVPSAAPAPAPPRPSAAPRAGARVSVAKSAERSAHRDATAGPITVIHLEENKALCDAAREVVARLPDSRYISALDATAPDASSSLLVVNLLSRAHDPVEAIAAFIAVDTSQRHVLAYCAEGTSGFSFGTADFFTQPIDADACVARLLESHGTIQRLLVVTENFSVTVALRDVLSRMQSSVSSAPDLRQVLELMPMINPNFLLIDLSLPRGEGLRLVSQLRSDPKTRALPLGILLAASGNAADIRQHAQRAARNLPMTAAHLAEALSQQLGVPLASGAPTTSGQSASALV